VPQRRRRTGDLIKVPGGSFRIMKALVGFREEIERQLERFPFEKNVFLMMRFRRENRPLSDFIIKNLSAAGLNGVRADQPDWNLTNNVYNPIAVLYCCKYGIALFDEAEKDQAYNPNVIYELGMMHSLRRDCIILRNDSLPPVPFDLIKDLYRPYGGKIAVRTNIQLWLQRITPMSGKPQVDARSTPASKLEYAAVSAQKNDKNWVIESPNSILATELSWRILTKDEKSWRLSWSINLTNKSRRAVNAKVQVLFLDEKGFALDDHTGPPQTLSPDTPYLYEATTALSPDLAGRMQRAVATVAKFR
jgi:hypothetical protein